MRPTDPRERGGYPLGGRRQRPHAPTGWDPARDSGEDPNEPMPPRGTVGTNRAEPDARPGRGRSR
ncbi:MAG: hypothetical protein HKP61_21940 [Dactylosporangium sp.]|nr:hypothetical protein [Dactylosporangium sp.]NNJ63542.1 hypothetical protein [Dactylosporangium sp.]